MGFDFFSVLLLLCGVTFLLYGMDIMSANLEKLAGGRLEKMLHTMTKKPFIAMLLGAAVTAVIQSSSATTVLLVGLVNSGLLDFASSIPVLMGANIGTTVTAWLISLSGISGESGFMKMLEPENFSAVLAFGSIMVLLISKDKKKRSVAHIFVAFAVLMYGMRLMKEAIEPLKSDPTFENIIEGMSNPVLALLVGIFITAVIQSSSASIALLQAIVIATPGMIPMQVAIPFVLGASIGTCITGILSSISANRDAKRVAFTQLFIKVVGGIAFMIVYFALDAIFDFPLNSQAATAVSIAVFHTLYSILNSLVQLPLVRWLVRIGMRLVPDDPKLVRRREEQPYLDELLLRTPAVAVAECANLTERMCVISRKTVLYSIYNLFNYNEGAGAVIEDNEQLVDEYEDVLGAYLVRISAMEITESDNALVSRMLHTIGDFERISDHAANLLDTSREINEKKIAFSQEAQEELRVLSNAVTEILFLMGAAYEQNDLSAAAHVEPLEQVIDGLIATIKDNHIRRLQNGNCTIELGFVLSDILNNFERISDHCSNIAVAVIDEARGSYDAHKYLNSVKHGDDAAFTESFEGYLTKYTLGA